MLNDLGIAATLSWFSREIEAAVPSMQVRHRVDVDEESISPQLKTEIFRISQEALNNVCKHARASTVELTLTGNQRGLDLVIRDNGRGIISGEGCPCGVGMGSMRERVELTGGELFIVTVDGKGVAIICRWVTPHSEIG